MGRFHRGLLTTSANDLFPARVYKAKQGEEKERSHPQLRTLCAYFGQKRKRRECCVSHARYKVSLELRFFPSNRVSRRVLCTCNGVLTGMEGQRNGMAE